MMHLTGLGAELRQTVRGLLKRPARTALVVLTLASGIAATTGIYTVVDAVVLRPLPYPEADRLVSVGRVFPDRPWREDAPELQRLAGTAIATFADWKTRARSFDALTAVEHRTMLLPGAAAGPELIQSASVTDGLFELLGAEAALGRLFEPGDFDPGAAPVMVLSHSTWLSRHGGNPDILGEDENQTTIVGVLAAGFRGPEGLVSSRVEYWRPLDPGHARYAGANRGGRSATVLGRLAPGTTVETARTEIAAIQDALATEHPDFNVFPDGSRFGAGVNLLQSQIVGGAAGPLSVFLGAAVLLLLIATMNSTNLLLIRGLERRSEASLRRALGASNGRIIAGMLLEGVCLAAAGGVLGLVVANVGVAWFLELGGVSLPRLAEVSLNPRIVTLCAGVTLGTGLIAGLVPALRVTRDTGLGSGTRQSGAWTVTPSGTRLRTALVAAQLGAALVLIIGASLLVNSLVRLNTSDLGFAPDGLTAISVPTKLPGTEPGPVWTLWDQIVREYQAVPGVTAVAAASDAPLQNPSWAPWVRRTTDDTATRFDDVSGMVITPTYFDAIGATVTRGRAFDVSDSADAEPVAIVNETFARLHLNGSPAIGQHLSLGGDDESAGPFRVVGVVDDVVLERVEDGPRAAMYVPHTQMDWPYGATVLARSARDDAGYGGDLRAAAARFNPSAPVLSLEPMTARIEGTIAEPRFRTLLLMAFASISAMLALIGLYGTLSHVVRHRTRELGVRMALGADRRAIASIVLRQGAGVVAIGLGLGLAGALGLARFLQSFLFGLDALDPLTFAAAGAAMTGVALLAVSVPARRAARVDIATILRD